MNQFKWYDMTMQETLPDIPIVKLPGKPNTRNGLRSWKRQEAKKFWLTVLFIGVIFLTEIAGLSFSLIRDNSLPGQSQLFPETFPLVSPTIVRCVHETLYFNSTGVQTGIDEICH